MISKREKCAEVFRHGPGKFTFYCTYCTEQFEIHYDALDHIETHFSLDKVQDCKIFKINSTEISPENPNNLQTESFFSMSAVFFPENKEIGIESIVNDENDTKIFAIQNEFQVQQSVLDPFSNSSDYFHEIKVEPVVIESTIESTPIEKPTKQPKIYKRPSECKKYARFGIITIKEIVECDKCHKRMRKQHMPNHWKSHMNLKSFACPTCKKKFNFKKTLDRHILCVHSDKNKRYCCQYCSHRFHELSNLNQHIRIHTGENPFKCEICGIGFNQSSMLKTHKRIHTQEKPYKCKYCNKRFGSTSNYWQHKRRHEGVTRFKCSTCDKEFLDKQDFKRHNMIHTGERPHSCNICNATFIERHALNQHLFTHTDEKPYKCRFCHLTFTLSHTRRLHERTVHNDVKRSEKIGLANNQPLSKHTGEKRYKCRYDGKDTEKFMIQNEFLQQPILNQFSPVKNNFSTDKVQEIQPVGLMSFIPENKATKIQSIENNTKIFVFQNEFLQHPVLDTFSKNSECLSDIKVEQADIESTIEAAPIQQPTKQPKNYERASRSKMYANFGIVRRNEKAECDKCHKQLQRQQMPQHWRLHMNPKSFVCPTCKKGFNLKKYLDRHILGVHSDKTKKYCCQYCSHRFSDYTNLKKHIYIHTGEKPYTCQFCGKGFNQPTILKTHLRIHTQEKPYKCENCDKQFGSTSSYWQHKRRHEGVTRFKCSTCDKEFFNKQDYKRHTMIHTGERPYSCDVCNATFIEKHALNQHLFTHTDEKPYKCRFCHLTFTLPHTRRSHERTVHNDIKRFEKIKYVI